MKNKIGLGFYAVLVLLAIVAFCILALHTVELFLCADNNLFYEILPPTIISLFALLATFTVIMNIIVNKSIQDKEKIENKEKNEKIIQGYVDSFKKEISIQLQRYGSLKLQIESDYDIPMSFKINLKSLINRHNKMLLNFDYLMTHSLHLYTDRKIIDSILNAKNLMLDSLAICDVLESDIIMKDHTLKYEKQIEQIQNLINKYIEITQKVNKELDKITFS